ncbi:MAG: hypothetical protein ACK5IP_12545 [Paracoccus sp. (in: a-proteobacteria)]
MTSKMKLPDLRALMGKRRAAASEAAAVMHGTVAKVRTEIARLQADIGKIEKAPVDRATAEATIRQSVANLAEHGRYLLKLKAWRAAAMTTDRPVHSMTVESTQDLLAIVAAFNADGAVAAALAPLEAVYADHTGLTDDERSARLGELEADLMAVEMLEELLARDADAGGMQIPRRKDVHPAVVLAPDDALAGA